MMNRMSRRTTKISKRTWLPPWDMPSDPIKAVWWFLHWSLKVLVRYFWIAIIAMMVYETYLNWRVSGAVNGIVAGVITLIVGLIVWGGLYLVLFTANISSTVSQTISGIDQMQRTFTGSGRRPSYPFSSPDPFDRYDRAESPEDNVVEGTITDLDEERKKRRREEL